MVSVLACPVSAPTLAGLFLFAIVFEKLVHGDAVQLRDLWEPLCAGKVNARFPLINSDIRNIKHFHYLSDGKPSIDSRLLESHNFTSNTMGAWLFRPFSILSIR